MSHDQLSQNDESFLHRVMYSNLQDKDKSKIEDMLIAQKCVSIVLDELVKSGIPFVESKGLVQLLEKAERGLRA